VISGFSSDFSASLPLEVNYYEDVADGTWMIGREDGEVKQTTDLDTWRPAATLWVAVGRAGFIGTLWNSTDGMTWTELGGKNMTEFTSITMGKDGSGDDLWIAGVRNSNNDPDIAIASDPTSIAGFVTQDITTSGFRGALDVGYGNGVWIIGGLHQIMRSTDYGVSWDNVYTYGGASYTSEGATIATDGNGDWVSVTHSGTAIEIVKSTDNGATWSLSYSWEGAASVWSAREISYANGMWIVATSDKKVHTCTSAGLADYTWTMTETLPKTPYDIYYANGIWMITGDDTRCYTSNDNGASWIDVGIIDNDASFNGVSLSFNDGVWICLIKNSGYSKIYSSNNDGGSWVLRYGISKLMEAVAINKVLPNT